LTHLQREALLTAARDSVNPFDFALVCLLGLLGLRIFEACGANIADLGEEHGHRVSQASMTEPDNRYIRLPEAAEVNNAVVPTIAGRP
jgi:integrase/recombinase XerD